MDPWDQLGEAIEALADEREIHVDVHRSAPSQLTVPSLVIRPDHPWRAAADPNQTFGRLAERYVIVAVVGAADPMSALHDLRDLIRLGADAADSMRAWHWVETAGIVATEDGGIDYLASTIRVTYSAED